RAFSRKMAEPTAQEEDLNAPLETRLSKKYSLPEWLISRWLKRFGEQETSEILEYAQKIPNLTLRCCQTAISTEGLKNIFENKGMKIEISKLMPDCINIIDRGTLGGPLSKLPGYEEGLFTVQDDASALVAKVLAPKPGWTIVDLCAAPGGKSFHLGELMENKGRIIAVDSSEKRLSLIAKERRRLGLTNIEAVVADGRSFKPEALCDAVLVDAPCSGTGVINRRSDLRQHREEMHIESLVEIQKALIENAAGMLKEGGVLIYSSCSIEAEENEEIVLWFKSRHPEFRLDNLSKFFNPELLQSWSEEAHWAESSKQLESGYIQLLPSRHGCSGFFISRFVRE
ncbi:MAG: methyltransferase domain-containing protein, partial [Candidatus Obscuribacterales bacterium]|nr:methyltransferase domain-containing protein [Candidatus Obscuribacterales bacterium]